MMGGIEKICLAVYERKRLCTALRAVSLVVTAVSVASFLYLAFVCFKISPLSLVRYLIITGVPFAVVSLLRRAVSLPRPYEVYTFYELPPKSKRGDSFPSRHTFSAFLIGTLFAFVSPFLSAILLVLGVMLATARVLLGIHFLRDVFVGAIVGVASALLGVLLASPF